ncbi:MAG: hypothetical protein OEY51_08015, partial [Cyclobacteriaceae bacterium]|nr:hypothetical protein [Cyclobacteriaceae bacterium]
MSEEILKHLPYEWPVDLIPEIQSFNNSSGSTLVVLDDDPTGTQTVHDIPVLADWSVESIRKEFDAGTGLFYILTNSRSLQEYGASVLAREIGRNLLAASALSNRKFRVISRSDSTLRGHYPAEVNALKEGLHMKEVKQVIMPFFLEGGRITINDIHYIREGGQLIPVSETPFARDASFGYKNADLKLWVQEKSKGEIESRDVCSISLNDLRDEGPLKTAEKIVNTDTTAFVVNAVTTRDAEVAALAFLLAEKQGAVLLYRTAATIVQTLAGLRPRPLLTKGELDLPPG